MVGAALGDITEQVHRKRALSPCGGGQGICMKAAQNDFRYEREHVIIIIIIFTKFKAFMSFVLKIDSKHGSNFEELEVA